MDRAKRLIQRPILLGVGALLFIVARLHLTAEWCGASLFALTGAYLLILAVKMFTKYTFGFLQMQILFYPEFSIV